MKHLIDGDEFGAEFVKNVINDAILFKNDKSKIPNLKGMVVSLLFFNKSLRTRFSFLSGISKLQVTSICENLDGIYKLEKSIGSVMNKDKPEHIKDMIGVLGRYSDLICIRDSDLTKDNTNSKIGERILKDLNIREFASFSSKPIINMESDAAHPMQGLADVMTMTEKLGDIKRKKVCITWVPHIKKLPIATPQSQILIPSIFEADVVLACPKDCVISEIYINKIKKYANSFTITHNQNEGIKDSDFVIAKSWSSIKNSEFDPYSAELKKWILTKNKMMLAGKKSGYFLHCMPIRRNVEVSDDVVDSDKSIMLDVAENRMWVQMSVINSILKYYEKN